MPPPRLPNSRTFIPTKDTPRTDRARTTIEGIARDIRHGVRGLAGAPWFTAAAVAALALGIGANSAILSVVQGVLLRPLAYAQPGRLVTILYKGHNPVSPANFLDWRRQARSFERMGAAEYWTTTVSGSDQPEKLYALRLTADVLPMLGVRPILGRAWTADDDTPGQDHIVVLSHGLWVRRFAADSGVIGRRLVLDGESYAVAAVMPDGFSFAPFWATRAELWAPLSLQSRTDRDGGSLRVFARLGAGVTLEQSRAEMATITARLEREFPHTNADMQVTDLTQQVVGNVRTPLFVILGAVAFVLLIACANVAHLLLARGAGRGREMALRVALGASRGRIVRQLLTESLLLAALGGAVGLLLARLGVRLLVVLGATSIPRVADIALDGRVVAATVAITLITGLLFGLAPAIRASATDLAGVLKDGGRAASGSGGRGRTRDALVASEFALALMLLVGAGLLIRSFTALQSLDPGFDARGLLTMVLPVTGTPESAPGKRLAFYEGVLERVRAIPGVQAAGAVNHIPIGGDSWGWPFKVEGAPVPKDGEGPVASYKVMMPGYFRAMRIPIVAGRDVNDADRMGAPGVVVVSEYLARQHWPGESAAGKRVSFDRDSLGHPVWLTVVGVVGNTIHDTWGVPPEDEAWLPMLQHKEYLTNPASHFAYLSLVVRAACAGSGARCDAGALAPAIRAAVGSLDPTVPVAELQTMDQIVDQATARQRFFLVLLGTFAAVALVLAAVGIYGVMSYSVSRRTHEIGMRIALGARPAQLLAQVVGEGMKVAAIGGLVGVVGALALSRLVSSLLYGVRPTDPETFVVVAVALAVVAAAACFIPARRATQVDPLQALRAE